MDKNPQAREFDLEVGAAISILLLMVSTAIAVRCFDNSVSHLIVAKAGTMVNFLTAIFSMLAAFYWYKSAANKLPPMIAYWGCAPAHDPFFVAMQKGIVLNRVAAIFSALAAAGGALSMLLAQ